MIVLVDLDWRKLALVDDVLVGKGADVEPVVDADGVRRPLPENIELSLEEPEVELLGIRLLGSVSWPICRLKDDKGLENGRLTRLGSRSQKRRVGGGLSPPKNSQTQRFGNIFQLSLGLFHSLRVRLEKEISHGVLTQRRELDVNLALKVLDEELMRDRGHDTSAITVSCIGPNGTTMGHVTEKVSRCESLEMSCREWTLGVNSPSLTILWLAVPLMWLQGVSDLRSQMLSSEVSVTMRNPHRRHLSQGSDHRDLCSIISGWHMTGRTRTLTASPAGHQPTRCFPRSGTHRDGIPLTRRRAEFDDRRTRRSGPC